MADKANPTDQTFSFDTVAVLVATIMENGGNLGAKEFKRMSALDGSRGEHGFNHMFRRVKARAKELNDKAKADGDLTPVKKSKPAAVKSAGKSGGKSAGKSGDGEAKKRVRKPVTKKSENAEDEDNAEESPSKKVKAEPKQESEAEEDAEADAPGEPNYEFEF